MATWNRALETLTRSELEVLQLKGLCKTLRRIRTAEPFRSRLAWSGLPSPETFGSLADWAKLPFTTAETFRGLAPLARSCVDRRELVELHLAPASSLAVASTKADLLQTAEALARGFAMAGLERGDAFAILEPLALSSDGLAGYQGCRKAGLFCIPVGEGDPLIQGRILRDYRVKGVLATAASLLRLPTGAYPSLKVALVPAVDLTEGLRQELEARLGVVIFPAYGRVETGGVGTVAHACREHEGLHVWEDQYFVEVIDPRTGTVLPDGERGELVVTTLAREAMPLLRYRTGDLARILTRETCSCGRTSLRLAFA